MAPARRRGRGQTWPALESALVTPPSVLLPLGLAYTAPMERSVRARVRKTGLTNQAVSPARGRTDAGSSCSRLCRAGACDRPPSNCWQWCARSASPSGRAPDGVRPREDGGPRARLPSKGPKLGDGRVGRRRRPRRLRVRFGNYPREISGRRGGRYTQISAQAKAEAADLFVVGSGASTDEEPGETGCRHHDAAGRKLPSVSDALISDAVVLDDALNTREERRFSGWPRVAWSARGNQLVRRVCLAPSSGEDGIATPSSRHASMAWR